MRIVQSNMELSSTHTASSQRFKKETLRAWVGDERPDFEGQEHAAQQNVIRPAERVSLSAAAQAVCKTPPCDKETEDAEGTLSPQLMVLVHILERMTGQKVRLISWKETRREYDVSVEKLARAPSSNAQRAGFGVEYDAIERQHEKESTRFAAAGVVKTADGREIHVSMSILMQREFLREQRISLRLGDAKLKDPLVLNFGNGPATLSPKSIDFDINADGNLDRIAILDSNSAFLVLDRNQDGQANDGRELFGVATGQGFEELAAYDVDQNHWIDENDPVFKGLQLWFTDEQGQSLLVSLKDANVGAIGLDHVSTPFSLKDGETLQGKIRSTGLFLTEDAEAKSVQQIDLAV